MTILLDSLNAAQYQATIQTEGPCMIIAGAGAGKTKVLTTRIAYLIEEKRIDPFHIMSLTFTNKAAKEMKSRITAIVGEKAKNIWLGTFHSCFAKILRIEAAKIGYPPNFSIYDTTDSKSLLKAIIKEMGLDEKSYLPAVVLSRISAAKNQLIGHEAYNSNPIYLADDELARKPKLGEIYAKYAKRCFQAGVMDFDDILLNTYLLFSQHIEVCYKYQDRFQYLLIDEFQDTNMAQYTILKELAVIHKNICVVGDDAQSIYAFRGADIRNMLYFEKDYPNLTIIKLEQNYRSTQTIVAAANSVISKNTTQLKKNVWTSNQKGDMIHVTRATSDIEEGRLIASSIFEIKSQYHLSNNDFAILYRTNSQSRSIEEALRKINLPYRIVGGMSFFQRKEIKDMLAYLRLIVNHNDEEALKRIINEPKRGIGPANIEKMLVIANENGMALWDTLRQAKHFLSSRVANAVEEFANMIEFFSLQLAKKDAYEIALEIAQRSGFLKALHEDKTVEGLGRYENVQELLNGIKSFTNHPNQTNISLTNFLEEVALSSTTAEEDSENEEKITLMTIHAAKGLEFQYIYLVGIEEDIFPSPLMLSSREDLEEERRLFYVALTRAKEKIFLSYCISRYRFGKLKTCEPSRFLGELPSNYLHITHNYQKARNNDRKEGNHYAKKLIQGLPKTKPAIPKQGYGLSQPMEHVPFQASDITLLRTGMQVLHPNFGKGSVVRLHETGMHQKATIQFEVHGEKTLLLSFAKLKIINDNDQN